MDSSSNQDYSFDPKNPKSAGHFIKHLRNLFEKGAPNLSGDPKTILQHLLASVLASSMHYNDKSFILAKNKADEALKEHQLELKKASNKCASVIADLQNKTSTDKSLKKRLDIVTTRYLTFQYEKRLSYKNEVQHENEMAYEERTALLALENLEMKEKYTRKELNFQSSLNDLYVRSE